MIINIQVDINSLSKTEAAAYIAEYEVITIRQKSLDEFKSGFNKFNVINVSL